MCEKIIKLIREKRKEFLKELTDNLLLTDEEYYATELRIELLNEILNKIKEQSKDQNRRHLYNGVLTEYCKKECEK